MPTIITKIDFDIPLNRSLQIEDYAYVSSVQTVNNTTHGYTTNTTISDPVYAGRIVIIGNGFIVIDKDPLAPPIINNEDFILFSKDNRVNESSLKGYYADVTLENSSNKKAELFAVSSEVAPSSK
jgi:hypothetical protein